MTSNVTGDNNKSIDKRNSASRLQFTVSTHYVEKKNGIVTNLRPEVTVQTLEQA
jgi:hypothetical protein